MRKDHKIHYLLILGFLTLLLTYKQTKGQSYIYNSKGQLIIDTTLTINQDQLNIWRLMESKMLSLISMNIDYSNMARESGIYGIAIVAFDFDSLDLKNIRLIKNIGGGLDENIIDGMERISEKIVLEFRLIQNLIKLNYQGTYYIPFEFSLIDLNEIMKKKNSIPIIDSKIPLNGR